MAQSKPLSEIETKTILKINEDLKRLQKYAATLLKPENSKCDSLTADFSTNASDISNIAKEIESSCKTIEDRHKASLGEHSKLNYLHTNVKRELDSMNDALKRKTQELENKRNERASLKITDESLAKIKAEIPKNTKLCSLLYTLFSTIRKLENNLPKTVQKCIDKNVKADIIKFNAGTMLQSDVDQKLDDLSKIDFNGGDPAASQKPEKNKQIYDDILESTKSLLDEAKAIKDVEKMRNDTSLKTKEFEAILTKIKELPTGTPLDSIISMLNKEKEEYTESNKLLKEHITNNPPSLQVSTIINWEVMMPAFDQIYTKAATQSSVEKHDAKLEASTSPQKEPATALKEIDTKEINADQAKCCTVI